jgi:hypothetical protein
MNLCFRDKLDEYTDEAAWRQIGQSYLALVLVVAAFALADRGGMKNNSAIRGIVTSS